MHLILLIVAILYVYQHTAFPDLKGVRTMNISD